MADAPFGGERHSVPGLPVIQVGDGPGVRPVALDPDIGAFLVEDDRGGGAVAVDGVGPGGHNRNRERGAAKAHLVEDDEHPGAGRTVRGSRQGDRARRGERGIGDYVDPGGAIGRRGERFVHVRNRHAVSGDGFRSLAAGQPPAVAKSLTTMRLLVVSTTHSPIWPVKLARLGAVLRRS